MDPFGSSSTSSSGLPSSSGASAEALMDQLKVQLAQAYAEEFIEIASATAPHSDCKEQMFCKVHHKAWIKPEWE